MATTIYLVRHGQTTENASGILQGHMPGHLSAIGIGQAEALSKELCKLSFQALLSSDLQRCADTADILNRPHKLTIQFTPLLRERDWGSFTGRCIADIQGIPFPEDVETVDALLARAETFLQKVRYEYPGQCLLVVSHGLFCRALQAVHFGHPLQEIKRMENAECRVLTLTEP